MDSGPLKQRCDSEEEEEEDSPIFSFPLFVVLFYCHGNGLP